MSKPIVVKPAFLLALLMTVLQSTRAQLHTFVEPKMGSAFEITINSPDSVGARAAAYKAFARIDAINLALSDYSEQSETWKINAAKSTGWVNLSHDLAAVLSLSEKISNETFGAFDPSVGAIVQLWRRARRKNELPVQEAIDQAASLSGMRLVQLDTTVTPGKLKMLKAGVQLDFGGIGKGYAADEALELLQRLGFDRSFVSAGSSIAAGSAPAGRERWEFLVDDSDKSGKRVEQLIACQNCFIASSGDLFQYMELGGRRYSHIIDPETGEALTNGAFVVVLAPTAALADAYATAFCVMEMEEIRRFLEVNDSISARVWKAGGAGLEELSMGPHFDGGIKRP